jgi:hypothetical protein
MSTFCTDCEKDGTLNDSCLKCKAKQDALKSGCVVCIQCEKDISITTDKLCIFCRAKECRLCHKKEIFFDSQDDICYACIYDQDVNENFKLLNSNDKDKIFELIHNEIIDKLLNVGEIPSWFIERENNNKTY